MEGTTNSDIIGASKDDFNGFPQKLISSDDIEKLHEKWLQIEHLPNMIKDGAYIVNTNNQHWWCMIVQYPSIFVIDPFGVYVNGSPPKQLIKWAKNHGFQTVYASEIDIQNLKSNECGYICLYIVKHIRPLIGTLTETKFDKWLKPQFNDLTNNKKGGLYNTKKVFKYISKLNI